MRTVLRAMALLVTPLPAAAQYAPEMDFIFEETVLLGEAIPAGETARGSRLIIPIIGGSFEGPLLRGEVLPMGWDWQLRRADGCTEVEADYFLRTHDDVIINVVNTGIICPPGDDGPVPVRTHPAFEAPLGKYDWLSKEAFVGTLEPDLDGEVPAVKIRFYRLR